MAAQALASLATTANGLLLDRFGSHYPGLLLAAALAAFGAAVCFVLGRSLTEEKLRSAAAAYKALAVVLAIWMENTLPLPGVLETLA